MPPEANDSRTPLDSPPLWTGLEEYMNSPAFRDAMVNEFPEQASEWTDPVTRRNFITIMGASLAMAGVVGCSPRPAPQRKIVPYREQPAQMTPGVPLLFASAFPLAGFGEGVLVRSHEGRPVKIEGNPDHSSSEGGTGVFAQASVLGLYDPDRSQRVSHGGGASTYLAATQAMRERLVPANGAKIRLLTGTVTSPSLAAQIKSLLDQLPGAKWCVHEPTAADNVREGTRRAYGKPLNVTYSFDRADVVLSLDADFLCSGPGATKYSRDFGARRRVRSKHFFEHMEAEHEAAHKTGAHHVHHENDYVTTDVEFGTKHDVKTLNRLYVVECMPTSTGSVADHRLPLLGSQIESLAREVAKTVIGGTTVPAPGALPSAAVTWAKHVADDLNTHKGKGTCIVVAGDHQPPSVHALALAMNEALGNIGKTVTLSAPVEAHFAADFTPHVVRFADLVNEMSAGAVETLLILGTNPAYTAPVDVPFTAAVAKVPFKVHFGLYQDETAILCDWHINEAHYLETWGDIRGHDGSVALQQPLIAPLYNGKSCLELLAEVAFNPAKLNPSTAPAAPTAPVTPIEGLELVKAYWSKTDAVMKSFPNFGRSGEFEPFWQEAVRSGVIKGTGASHDVTAKLGNWAADSPPAAALPGEYEINFRFDPTLFDGRFANNGWLQELPKPVTKLTWDNAAFVGTATGKKLGIEKEFRWTAGEHGRAEVSVVELEYKGRKVKAPVWTLPGHPEGSVTVHLGAGRERAGRVGNAPNEPNAAGKPIRGFDAYVLRDSQHPSFDGGLKVTKVGGGYFLACIQGGGLTTGSKDPISGKPTPDRNPARQGSVKLYTEDPSFARRPPTAVGETALIAENVPGSTGHHAHGGNGHDDHEEGHDKRLHPLTMYKDNPALFPQLPADRQRKWAMAIDLGACTGCNACMVACQSENNIPVVGKREVTRGREMLWIRVDRYYSGNPDDAASVETRFQPVPCQQCEKAPCEVVCPVGATVHSTDGLNDMVYNRCVGTRYCSNNCPYKVRRFNFLTFQDWATESLKLGRNPDVSVRSRGVMEKCTYCVQRIRGAEIVAEREHRGIRDGEIVTACQAACPSGAIVFGDLLADHSLVSEWKAEPTNYGLLAELNTMPRTSYLAGIRNPNPLMK